LQAGRGKVTSSSGSWKKLKEFVKGGVRGPSCDRGERQVPAPRLKSKRGDPKGREAHSGAEVKFDGPSWLKKKRWLGCAEDAT